jgi:5-methylcytosine-specific restriction protein B
MYLLEYRDKKIRLAGSSEPFGIPENVRIIGTMNTADRSIALVDHALRRRFAFIELRPNYEVLRQYHEKKKTGFKVDGLIETLKELNRAIANKHYEIGISFFLTENLVEEIEDIWQMEIEPYLEEYFYDQLEKVDEFRWSKIEQQVRL